MSVWSQISAAVRELEEGRLVAIPTETVYGLAGNIEHPDSIDQIFKTKERPFFDPLIVHIGRINQLEALVSDFPKEAKILADHFWPGPLTLVLPRSEKVDSKITAGLDSVGIRMPSHPLTRRILRSLKSPVAAPSANRFGKTSPTQKEHVESEFPNADFFILDGGSSDRGIESSVIRASENRIEILRPGPIGAEEILSCFREYSICPKIEYVKSEAAPGHTPYHYQPDIPLVWSSRPTMSADDLMSIQRNLQLSSLQYRYLELPSDAQQAARVLYSELRRLAKTSIDFILFSTPTELKGDWRPLFDRLERASSLHI